MQDKLKLKPSAGSEQTTQSNKRLKCLNFATRKCCNQDEHSNNYYDTNDKNIYTWQSTAKTLEASDTFGGTRSDLKCHWKIIFVYDKYTEL